MTNTIIALPKSRLIDTKNKSQCSRRRRSARPPPAVPLRRTPATQQTQYLGESAETPETTANSLELPVPATVLWAATPQQFPSAATILTHRAIQRLPRNIQHILAPNLLAQASVRSTLTLQNEQENCRFTWDWWPRLPPVSPPTTGESFPAPPSARTSPHERSHPHDGVVFGARVLPAPWLSSVGAVAMSSDLLSAPPLGPHAGGAVASPSAFMFAPPLGSYAGGLAASQTSASALYPPIGSHAVAMSSELVPAPPLGSHGSFFRPAPRLSRRRHDGVVFVARHLPYFASPCHALRASDASRPLLRTPRTAYITTYNHIHHLVAPPASVSVRPLSPSRAPLAVCPLLRPPRLCLCLTCIAFPHLCRR